MVFGLQTENDSTSSKIEQPDPIETIDLCIVWGL